MSDNKVKHSVYLIRDLLHESRGAVLALGAEGVEPSNISALFNDAVKRELERLRERHNFGQPFPLYKSRLPGGRPPSNGVGTPVRKPIGQKLRFAVLERDRFRCRYCGTDERIEVDHVVPVSKGGDSDMSNLVAACIDCNQGKFDRLVDGD